MTMTFNPFLQGEFFLKKGVTWQEAWDVEADEKFELTCDY